MIAVSGFKFVIDDLRCRRTQFILACSLGIGMGTSMAYNSHYMGHDANCSYTLGNPNKVPFINNGTLAYQLAPGIDGGITDGTSRSILDSGLTMGVLVGFFMNLLIPYGFLGFEEMSLNALKADKEKIIESAVDDNEGGQADDNAGGIELPETKESKQFYDVNSVDAKREPELRAE